jgi:hypothetical protein
LARRKTDGWERCCGGAMVVQAALLQSKDNIESPSDDSPTRN